MTRGHRSLKRDAAYRRRYRAECRERLARDPACAEHGEPKTYRDYGCRCDQCRAAVAREHLERKQSNPGRKNQLARERRLLNKAKLNDDRTVVEHGKASTYNEHRCRCVACKDAAVADVRRSREKKKMTGLGKR